MTIVNITIDKATISRYFSYKGYVLYAVQAKYIIVYSVLGCWYRDANERFFSKIGVFNEMRVILQKK
jgi:hypothetical protein